MKTRNCFSLPVISFSLPRLLVQNRLRQVMFAGVMFFAGALGFPSLGVAEEGAVASEVPVAAATAAPAYNGADTAWVLICSALVLMMTAPGLALFYGGLVRKKNVLGVMMQCIFLMGIMSLIWAVYGYSLVFSTDMPGSGGFVGGGDYLLFNGIVPTITKAGHQIPVQGTLPKTVHFLFQMMFFIITPALICGGFAERMRFGAMVVFSILWGTLIYCPVAHWVWSDYGWFSEFNKTPVFKAYDFAGGTVVHITSGFSALVCAIMLGKRLGYGQEPMPPHNLTFTFIGSAMLWVGWFGFNAGSALTAGHAAANAFLATHMAAAAGVVTWAGVEWAKRGKPSILGACSGAVAGLVCVTPACGTCSPMAGIILGVAAGLVCFFFCTTVKNTFKYDDTLDAFGVHGVGGLLGAILTGVYATRSLTGAELAVGLVDGNPIQVGYQAGAALAAIALAVVGTIVLLKLTDAVIGLRVNQSSELQGLDIAEHGEEGYIFL